jgi:hypothetical protein
MNLSDAIREGCKIAPVQLYRQFFDRFSELGRFAFFSVPKGACALGAALYGSGGFNDVFASEMRHPGAEASSRFPILLSLTICPTAACPLFVGGTTLELGNVVTHLNDEHRWTREAIAMWVETLEQKIDEEAIAASVSDAAFNAFASAMLAVPAVIIERSDGNLYAVVEQSVERQKAKP